MHACGRIFFALFITFRIFELWSTFMTNALKLFLSHSLSLKNTESTWQMPSFHGYSVAYVDADTGRRFWQHEKTGETTWY